MNASEIAFVARALKAPRIAEHAVALAEFARAHEWDYEEYLVAVLREELSARETHGGVSRVRAAKFPQVKTLDDFDFSFAKSLDQRLIKHLCQLDFLLEKKNIIFLGPPGTGKTHLSTAIAVQAARRGHRVAFASASEWVSRLSRARQQGRLDEELDKLRRISLLVVDEVGYIPFDPDAASLFFSLVASRYERASTIVTSNKTFSAWTEIFGDAVAVAAMVDRLVHHAEIITIEGDSYRLRSRERTISPNKGR
jgi:DNA replication protein DnaC